MSNQAGWQEHARHRITVPCRTCGRPIEVFDVSGFWIRNNIDVAFWGGGHWLAYKWIPDHTILIELMIEPRDEEAFLYGHEIPENAVMHKRGLTYAKAHTDYGNEDEAKYRREQGWGPSPHPKGETA